MHKDKHSKTKKKWIAGAIGKPGTLHKELGVPQGKKIPIATLTSHDKGNSVLAKRARLAETLRGFKRWNQQTSTPART